MNNYIYNLMLRFIVCSIHAYNPLNSTMSGNARGQSWVSHLTTRVVLGLLDAIRWHPNKQDDGLLSSES